MELNLPQTGPTFTVTTTSDYDGDCTEDDCTLLQALYTTNAVTDANTVQFAPGSTGNILTSRTLGGLVISNPVAINGPGARQLAIHGDIVTRIFNVQSANVTISGLTLRNGRVADENGGGIFNKAG